MIRLLIISLLLSSCQKEITCDDWGVCDGFEPRCVPAKRVTIPNETIDCCEHEALTIGSYTVIVHPDLLSKVKDCLTMNLKDSAGYYRVMSKGIYDYNGNQSPYVQIGGSDQGWLGHENSTYFFIMDFPEWNTVTTIFKPRL